MPKSGNFPLYREYILFILYQQRKVINEDDLEINNELNDDVDLNIMSSIFS